MVRSRGTPDQGGGIVKMTMFTRALKAYDFRCKTVKRWA